MYKNVNIEIENTCNKISNKYSMTSYKNSTNIHENEVQSNTEIEPRVYELLN